MTRKSTKQTKINIMTLNCGGLTQITDTQIRDIIQQENIHITILQETKRLVRSESQFQTYTQAGHNIISLTHPNGQHGLQIWINNKLSSSFLEQHSKYNSNLEYITIRLHYLTIVNIYRKHSPTSQHYMISMH
jgi:exonuclease III